MLLSTDSERVRTESLVTEDTEEQWLMLKRPYEVDGGGRMAGGDSLRCGSKGLKDTAYIN